MPSLGALKDHTDSRDYDFANPRLAKAEIANEAVLPSLYEPGPPGSQESIGACVAWACVAVREILIRRMAPDTIVRLSPLFLYWEARQLGGIQGDSGSYLRDGFKALANVGLPPEHLWPYDTAKVLASPDSRAYQQALNYRIYVYRRLQTIGDMKQCLSSGFPFALSMAVFPAGPFTYLPLDNNTLQMPAPGATSELGHAICVMGYVRNLFLARNSWGPEWGSGGHFWIPFDYVERYMWDAWMAEA